MAMDDRDMKNLIETMDLYLELIKNDLPELRAENKKASSNLQQLVIESRKVTNLGHLLVEIKELFRDIKRELPQQKIERKEIELIANQYKSLKNSLIVAYGLLGFFAGYAINYFLQI